MGRCLPIACGLVGLTVTSFGVAVGNSEHLATIPFLDWDRSPVRGGNGEASVFEDGDEELIKAQALDTVLMANAQPRRLGAAVAKRCMPVDGGSNQTVTLSPYTLTAEFDCGTSIDSLNVPNPDCRENPSNTSCDVTGTACQTPISSIGAEGSITMDKSTHVITLKLDDVPTQVGPLYFKCTNGVKSCTVTVDMPEPFKENQCTFDRKVRLTAISAANTEVQFECRGPVTKTPTEALVYEGPECTGAPRQLKDVVPGATLEDPGDGTYTLRVASLPKEAQHLCFQCAYKDPRKKENEAASLAPCKVTAVVNASGSPPSGGSTGTTTTTTVSGASAVSWFAASAISVVSTAGAQ